MHRIDFTTRRQDQNAVLLAVAERRRGLAGAAFELDDRCPGYDARTIAAVGFEDGKTLTRIGLREQDTAATLEATAHAVTALASHDLMAVVEPSMSTVQDGRVVNDLATAAVVRSVGIATGPGASNRHNWWKLPVVDPMEEVAASTTMPVLLLGGDPKGSPDETYAAWRATAAEVREDLPDAPSYSAVRALLRILEEKDQLRHRRDGQRYVYRATRAREDAGSSALQRTVRTFFDGSATRAVAALLDLESERLDDAELDRLERLIDDARSQGR